MNSWVCETGEYEKEKADIPAIRPGHNRAAVLDASHDIHADDGCYPFGTQLPQIGTGECGRGCHAGDAANSDGFRYITLPLLRNTLCTCLVLAVTGALKVFDLPWVMFGAGMPEDRGWLTGTYMYDQTFNKANIDYGSTIAVLIVVLGVVLSNVSKALFRPTDDY